MNIWSTLNILRLQLTYILNATVFFWKCKKYGYKNQWSLGCKSAKFWHITVEARTFYQGFYRIIFSENYAKSVRSLGFNINNTSGAPHKQSGGGLIFNFKGHKMFKGKKMPWKITGSATLRKTVGGFSTPFLCNKQRKCLLFLLAIKRTDFTSSSSLKNTLFVYPSVRKLHLVV